MICKNVFSKCDYVKNRAVFLILFLIGIIHLDGIGQSSKNIDPLRFKVGSDILYEYYDNNKSELSRISMLIEKHTNDILLNKGYFQLVAYVPKETQDDPTTLNQAAGCAAVVRNWMRNQSPLLSKMACAFSFSTSNTRNVEVDVCYIEAPLSENIPQAIHFSNDKTDLETIQFALSKYKTLPFVESGRREVPGDKKSDTISQQTDNPSNTHQVLPADSTGDSTAFHLDFVIYFRVDKSIIDPAYMNNAAVLKRMGSIVANRNIAYIDSLIISAYASPEAPSEYNKRLSERRANAVRDYFVKEFVLLNPDIIRARGCGENWEGLRRLVVEDSQLPMRDKVLDIIDSNLPEDERELRLKALQGGDVYRYIYKNLYPRLRLGATFNVILVEAVPENLRALVPAPVIVNRIDPLPPIPIRPIVPVETKKYPFAIRTNLLYDAIGALNIGVELPFGKKKNWSAIASIAYSYWHSAKNLYALQTLEYGLESRYWFGVSQKRKDRNPAWEQPLKGFYVGVYGGYWQRYDVQSVDGYQGDGSWSAGLTAGYVMPINRSLSLDFGIGAGWFSTSEYRHYHQPEYDKDGNYHLMWQQTGSWGGLSLTKLRAALVWTIQTTRTQKGEGRGR